MLFASCMARTGFYELDYGTYGEILPDVCVAVLSQALIVESVDLRDLTRLMVAAQDCDSLFVPDLKF